MRPMIRCTASRRAVLSRLLRPLLLPAALHILRPPSAGGQAAARQYRRCGRFDRGGGAHPRFRGVEGDPDAGLSIVINLARIFDDLRKGATREDTPPTGGANRMRT
jgi:hypothetical protein